MAFALPAASVPPTIVQTTRTAQSVQAMPGTWRVARTMAGTVVTSSSSMMRGFVSAMYARIVSRAGCAAPTRVRPPGSRPLVAPAPTRAV